MGKKPNKPVRPNARAPNIAEELGGLGYKKGRRKRLARTIEDLNRRVEALEALKDATTNNQLSGENGK